MCVFASDSWVDIVLFAPILESHQPIKLFIFYLFFLSIYCNMLRWIMSLIKYISQELFNYSFKNNWKICLFMFLLLNACSLVTTSILNIYYMNITLLYRLYTIIIILYIHYTHTYKYKMITSLYKYYNHIRVNVLKLLIKQELSFRCRVNHYIISLNGFSPLIIRGHTSFVEF